MNLDTLLAILKEINQIVATLNGMGLKLDGTIDLADILKLAGPK